MSSFYFQKSPWLTFVYQDVSFDLSHLNECTRDVIDSEGITRRIAVTFTDHCFTCDSEPGGDPNLFYPGCSRNPGYFSIERYHHSLTIAEHLTEAVRGKVWYVDGDSYAIVPTVDHRGNRVLYGIIFSLDRVSGLPVQLHMRIKSAYPCDKKPVITFGEVRFQHLVKLRMQGKHPPRITNKHRKRPTIRQVR